MSPINFLYEPAKAPAIYLFVSPIYPSNAKMAQKNVIFEKPQSSKNCNLQKTAIFKKTGLKIGLDAKVLISLSSQTKSIPTRY